MTNHFLGDIIPMLHGDPSPMGPLPMERGGIPHATEEPPKKQGKSDVFMANNMNQKKMYVAKLADFLASHNMTMSGSELADHLNRNNFLTGYDEEYKSERTFRLIQETYNWLKRLGLDDDANNFPLAFVNDNSELIWDKKPS
jgi:hypothetical protein